LSSARDFRIRRSRVPWRRVRTLSYRMTIRRLL
jgi:hypothetical protein